MGHGATTTTDEVLAGRDLNGTVVVVTGGSGGLGLETARSLAAHGAEVVMTVRDAAKAEAAGAQVGVRARLVTLDLTSLASVRAAAADIRELVPRVDVLINNAGVMATPEGRTAEGFELQLGVNHLAHFLLTARLAPAMSRESSRVVNVSSLGHMVSGMIWDDPHYRSRPYHKWEAYGQSKTANILFALGLAKHGRTAYAVHPGMIGTDLYRYLPADERAAIEGPAHDTEGRAKTVEQGAATSVWAAIADGIASGSYLADCAVDTALPHATDPDDVDRLWTWSQEQVGEAFSP